MRPNLYDNYPIRPKPYPYSNLTKLSNIVYNNNWILPISCNRNRKYSSNCNNIFLFFVFILFKIFLHLFDPKRWACYLLSRSLSKRSFYKHFIIDYSLTGSASLAVISSNARAEL